MKKTPDQANHRSGYRNYGTRPSAQSAKKRRLTSKIILALVILIAIVGLSVATTDSGTTKTYTVAQTHSKQQPAGPTSSTPAQQLVKEYTPTSTIMATSSDSSVCASNSLTQLIVVSISQQHLWACGGSSVAYDSPDVTGMMDLPADLTPVGTYHVYAKQTNVWLNGSDSTGSWHDFVYYWMPFLDNQYGIYGFHDATWRPSSAFGNINPYSTNASHGCVECPLATAAWLYHWAQIGTAVTVEP